MYHLIRIDLFDFIQCELVMPPLFVLVKVFVFGPTPVQGRFQPSGIDNVVSIYPTSGAIMIRGNRLPFLETFKTEGVPAVGEGKWVHHGLGETNEAGRVGRCWLGSLQR
mmetsp:Transcript_9810/g.24434  ORF Transcript_9810/g.24434 Transcript_9810/m.24434 type:complete len:109 (-) Transcript_9810:353-679(-)